MVVFRKNKGLNVRFYVQNPEKAHPCAELHLLTYFAWSVWVSRLWARGRTKKTNILGVIFHPYGEKKNPGRICTKFCTGGDIQDVITDANLEDDQLSHLH